MIVAMTKGLKKKPATKSKLLGHVKQKPYFSSDDFVLYKNDSLKILEQLPENSIDMVLQILHTISPMVGSPYMLVAC